MHLLTSHYYFSLYGYMLQMWDLREEPGDKRGESPPSSVQMTLLQEKDDANTSLGEKSSRNSNCSYVSQECTLLHTYKMTSEGTGVV